MRIGKFYLNSALVLIFITLAVVGCGTHVVKYKPESGMTLDESIRTIDRLIMEQHPTWRPDFVEINEQFILLGYGVVTQGRGSTVLLSQNITIGSSSSGTRAKGNRVYFESTEKVILYSWKRKFKQWYVVSLVGKHRQHMLRTRYLECNAPLYLRPPPTHHPALT